MLGILDLVSEWNPQARFPGIWQFRTRDGLYGFGSEDGKTLHVAELYAGPGAGAKARILRFAVLAQSIYSRVLVEGPMKPDLHRAMTLDGFRPCSIRAPAREFNPEVFKSVNRRRSGIWVSGLVWEMEIKLVPVGKRLGTPRPG